MARQPARRPGADQQEPELDEAVEASLDEAEATEEEPVDVDDSDDTGDADDTGDTGDTGDADETSDSDEASEARPQRTTQVTKFWEKVRIDPIEVALPAGVGYTLRAYRLDTDIVPSDFSAREDELEFPDRAAVYGDDDEDALDDEELDEFDELEDDDEDESDKDDEDNEDSDADDEEDEDASDKDDEADEEEEEYPAEEVPLFLSHAGQLLVFRTPESLVEFVRSDAEHDLSQLDTWSRVVDDVRAEYIAPLPEDVYELDLVVKNLRASHEAWDPALIVQCGQFARDLGHALRIESVVKALQPGSPLDDLDEALRAVAAGGLGTFFARRKAKKIGTETASLGWRTAIGKISAVVDWRD